jgi:hypothetical protein
MLHVFLVWPWNPKTSFFLKYQTVSILFDILSFEKSNTAPYKSWKKFLRNWVCRVSKEAEFCADFKNGQKSRVWQKGKKFLQKNWIFGDLENLAKNSFSEKNLWKLLDARVLHIFEISAKFRFFWCPAHPI